MSDEKREIEAKFAIDRADHAALAAVERAGDFVVRSRRTFQQDDIYFDTADGVLSRTPASLRVRRNEDGAFMTFKGSRSADEAAHVASRLEDEVPIGSDYDRHVSSEAALPDDASLSPLRRARQIVGDAELLPAARLVNQRTAILFENDAGQSLELSIDRCVGTRFRDDRRVEFEEVELETKSADRDAIDQVCEHLTGVAPSLRPNHRTKLERVLG